MKRLLLFSCLSLILGVAYPSWGSIMFPASGGEQSCAQSSTSTLTCTASMTFATGDAVVLYAAEHGSGFSYSVSDTCSQSWTHQSSASFTETVVIQIDAWTVTNATAGTCSITVTRSAGSVRFQWIATHYSGVTALGSMTASGNGSSGTCSISLTTTDDNNFVVAGFANFAAETYTASVGNLRGQVSNVVIASALSDNTAATPSSVTNTVSLSTNAACATGAIELRSGARTDTALTTAIIPQSPSYTYVCPPAAGTATCTPGTDGENLSSTGWLTGVNTIMTDPNYNNVSILRLTDYNDTVTYTCPGAEIGPGGSAEENVFSSDDMYIMINCQNGGIRMKTMNPTTFQTGGYVTGWGGTPGYAMPAGGEFSYTTAGSVYLMNSNLVQNYTVSGSAVASGPTTVADFTYAIPCWQNSCPDWASGTYSLGTNLIPLTGNSGDTKGPHVFQLMNNGTLPCTTGGTYPTWGSSGTSELTMITDGGCTWLDIGPTNVLTHTYAGLVSHDGLKWAGGLANYQGDGGKGSIFVVYYNSSTQTYYHLNTATGNYYSAACVGGTGPTCSGGTFTRHFAANIIPPTGMSAEDLIILHNVKIGKGGDYITIGPQKCAFTSYQCPNSGGGPISFWQVGTSTINWGPAAVGHHASGYSTLASEIGYSMSSDIYSFGTPFAGGTPAHYWDMSTLTCTPNPCPTSPPFDYHVSWTADNSTDTAPVCGATLSNSVSSGSSDWPFQYPYQGEVICYTTDGTKIASRQGFTYNTYGSIVFNANQNVGALSSDGKYFGVTSDWWNTLGSTSDTASCAGGFNWIPNHPYNLMEQVSPGTNSAPVLGGTVFYVDSCSGGGGCMSGSTPPTWSLSGGVTDGNITWDVSTVNSGKSNAGLNNCETGVFIFKLQ